jgi:hypothetical protein
VLCTLVVHIRSPHLCGDLCDACCHLKVEHAGHSSEGARLIKLADKLYNCRDLLRVPPRGWSLARIRGYFVWSRKVIEALDGTNEALEALHRELWTREITWEGTSSSVMPDGDLEQALQDYYTSLMNVDD